MKKLIAGVFAAVMAISMSVGVAAANVARVRFFVDSDPAKYYVKLSTKWENDDYKTYFNDQDAYWIEFKGAPKLSSTSRADLEIYYPFVDSEGNGTVNPENVCIYQVVDGELYNVTDHFTYEENDEGAPVFATRTRFLGTYILAEKAVDVLDTNGDSPLSEEDGFLSSKKPEKDFYAPSSGETGIILPSYAEDQ